MRIKTRSRRVNTANFETQVQYSENSENPKARRGLVDVATIGSAAEFLPRSSLETGEKNRRYYTLSFVNSYRVAWISAWSRCVSRSRKHIIVVFDRRRTGVNPCTHSRRWKTGNGRYVREKRISWRFPGPVVVDRRPTKRSRCYWFNFNFDSYCFRTDRTMVRRACVAFLDLRPLKKFHPSVRVRFFGRHDDTS